MPRLKRHVTSQSQHKNFLKPGIIVKMNVRPSKLTIIVFLLRHNVADITLTDNFQYHDKSIDTENISP